MQFPHSMITFRNQDKLSEEAFQRMANRLYEDLNQFNWGDIYPDEFTHPIYDFTQEVSNLKIDTSKQLNLALHNSQFLGDAIFRPLIPDDIEDENIKITVEERVYAMGEILKHVYKKAHPGTMGEPLIGELSPIYTGYHVTHKVTHRYPQLEANDEHLNLEFDVILLQNVFGTDKPDMGIYIQYTQGLQMSFLPYIVPTYGRLTIPRRYLSFTFGVKTDTDRSIIVVQGGEEPGKNYVRLYQDDLLMQLSYYINVNEEWKRMKRVMSLSGLLGEFTESPVNGWYTWNTSDKYTWNLRNPGTSLVDTKQCYHNAWNSPIKWTTYAATRKECNTIDLAYDDPENRRLASFISVLTDGNGTSIAEAQKTIDLDGEFWDVSVDGISMMPLHRRPLMENN